MIHRNAILSAARSLVGTPFHHMGRTAQRACDCPGVIVLVANAIGYKLQTPVSYSRRPARGLLLQTMRLNFDEIPLEQAKPADILTMWFDRGTRDAQHLGILTEAGGMVHAWEVVGSVVESTCQLWMRRRATNAFAFRGVQPWQP